MFQQNASVYANLFARKFVLQINVECCNCLWWKVSRKEKQHAVGQGSIEGCSAVEEKE